MNEKIIELYAEAKRSTKEGRMNAPIVDWQQCSADALARHKARKE